MCRRRSPPRRTATCAAGRRAPRRGHHRRDRRQAGRRAPGDDHHHGRSRRRRTAQVRTIAGGNEYAAYDLTGQPDGSVKLTMKPLGDHGSGNAHAGHLDRDHPRAHRRARRLGADHPEVRSGRQPDPGRAAGRRRPGPGGRGDSVDLQAGNPCGGRADPFARRPGRPRCERRNDPDRTRCWCTARRRRARPTRSGC